MSMGVATLAPGLDSFGLAEALSDAAIAESALNDEHLADIWDSWSTRWEKEFDRLDSLEELWKKKAELQANLEVVREAEYAHLEEERARRRQVDAVEEEMRREEACQQLKAGAAQNRKDIANAILEENEDMVRRITENAAKRRLENEARRRKQREAAREAQFKRFQDRRNSSTNSSSSPRQVPPKASPPPQTSSVPKSRVVRGEATKPRPPDRFTSFEEFDEAWSQFEQRAKAGETSLQFADVPWPTSLATVSGVNACESLDARKQKLRAALVRWHPDKWGKLLDSICEAERPRVVEKVKEVTRRIIEEKGRYLK
jgi:hypothetical protein